MRRLYLAAALSAAVVAGVSCPPARAQSSSALIAERLDQQVNFNTNATLPQAIEAIRTDTGVPIVAGAGVYDVLPWGEQTNIVAKIENQTLRQALDAITRKLGLTFVLTDQTVELRPVAALRRLGRRATVEELQVLDLLAGTPLNPQTDRLGARDLLAAIDQRLQDAKSPFAVENRAFGPGPADNPGGPVVPVARNASLADALDAVPQATDATWYPWGRSIVIVHKEDQVRTQLQKTLTARYDGVDLSQVLSELSGRSGVPFAVEPGAVQKLSADVRNVKVLFENTPIQQCLETLAGFTGLTYVVNDKGVYLWNPAAPAASDGAAGPREPMLGLVQLDNGVQVLVPQSLVPPDVRDYLKHKTQQQWEKIRQQMKDEGYKPDPPTTQPATPPPPPAAPPTTLKADDL